nr:hypothetical protein [Curtobacterium sp. WW7]
MTVVLGPVAAFWTAYVLTRPVGASFADWIAVPHSRGGLGAGTGLVSALLAVVIATVVAWTSQYHRVTRISGVRDGGRDAAGTGT